MLAWGLGGTGAALLLAAGLGGCGTAGYYAQAARGHLDMLARAKPVPEWLADGHTPAALRDRLALSQRIRDFAVSELQLPDNRSYRSYVDLGRGAAVWNVVATPELSLQLKTWCFPVVGCVGYRGYYDRSAADALAAELRAQGWEAGVYGVPAYSTLGWSEWLGGDPLLNTFIHYPEGELARMVFHELAHQVAYADDDTAFNESFATAVERIGGQRWLAQHASAAAREAYAALDARRREFRALTFAARTDLDTLFRSDAPEAEKRRRKAERMARLRADYEAMKRERWGGFAGYDGWFERANNPALAVQGAYNDLVPQFERLFEREGRDFARFYAEVRRLAAMPKTERRAALAAAP
ncbi:aminopeptidase [Aquincola sp. GCM10022187]